MKVKLHIPTEQYGYVEIEMEPNPETFAKSPEEVIQDAFWFYNGSKKLQEASGSTTKGLAIKDFNMALDRYLTENKMDSNLYQAMSPEQKSVCQEIKKSLARIKAKEPQELRIRE